jgi:hypothetical protein
MPIGLSKTRGDYYLSGFSENFSTPFESTQRAPFSSSHGTAALLKRVWNQSRPVLRRTGRGGTDTGGKAPGELGGGGLTSDSTREESCWMIS